MPKQFHILITASLPQASLLYFHPGHLSTYLRQPISVQLDNSHSTRTQLSTQSSSSSPLSSIFYQLEFPGSYMSLFMLFNSLYVIGLLDWYCYCSWNPIRILFILIGFTSLVTYSMSFLPRGLGRVQRSSIRRFACSYVLPRFVQSNVLHAIMCYCGLPQRYTFLYWSILFSAFIQLVLYLVLHLVPYLVPNLVPGLVPSLILHVVLSHL